MSLPQDRAASRERKVAKIFGTTRVVRKAKGRLPDALPFALESGEVVQLEVKNGMKRCPRVLVKALEQARGYTPEATPVAVFSDVGGMDIACVPAKDLARWMGIEAEKLTPKIIKKKVKRPFRQLEMFGEANSEAPIETYPSSVIAHSSPAVTMPLAHMGEKSQVESLTTNAPRSEPQSAEVEP